MSDKIVWFQIKQINNHLDAFVQLVNFSTACIKKNKHKKDMYKFFAIQCVCVDPCVCAQTCSSVSQESVLCVKSPGEQHMPADDPDTIPETVSSSSCLLHSGLELNHTTRSALLLWITKQQCASEPCSLMGLYL